MSEHSATDGGRFIPSAKVRAYIYGIVCAASPLAIIYGLVTTEQAGLWVAFGAGVLGLTNGMALANTGKSE